LYGELRQKTLEAMQAALESGDLSAILLPPGWTYEVVEEVDVIRLEPSKAGTLDAEVELTPAHAWHCPVCDAENFCRGCAPELPEEEEREIKMSLGYEPWEEGCILIAPNEVTCSECGRSFRTRDWRAESDDGDELH
jgi:hypothetical protein